MHALLKLTQEVLRPLDHFVGLAYPLPRVKLNTHGTYGTASTELVPGTGQRV